SSYWGWPGHGSLRLRLVSERVGHIIAGSTQRLSYWPFALASSSLACRHVPTHCGCPKTSTLSPHQGRSPLPLTRLAMSREYSIATLVLPLMLPFVPLESERR